jgi:hypothetical protein
MTDPVDPPDPDLDDIVREGLGDLADGRLLVGVADALDQWGAAWMHAWYLAARRGNGQAGHDWHGVGLFLDELAARGIRVELTDRCPGCDHRSVHSDDGCWFTTTTGRCPCKLTSINGPLLPPPKD